MACELIWSPSARLDLRSIFEFIARDNPAAARRVFGRIFHAVEQLAEFPESGRMVPEFEGPAIREVVQSPFRIVYRYRGDRERIEIVRVWHAARGIPAI